MGNGAAGLLQIRFAVPNEQRSDLLTSSTHHLYSLYMAAIKHNLFMNFWAKTLGSATVRGISVFDRRLFILGVFLLLFALGTVEGPRGDAGWRLVVTGQIIDFGRVHLPEHPGRPGLIETPSGWTSFSPIGQTLLFIPFEFAGKVLSVVLGDYRGRAFPLTYLYCPLVGVGYFLALLALLEVFGLSSRAAGITSLVFTFCSLPAYYVAQSFQEEAIASIFVCLSLRAALLWRRSPEKRYAFEAGLFGASIFLFRINGIFALIPVAVLFAQGLYAVGVGSSRAHQTAGAALLGALAPAAVRPILRTFVLAIRSPPGTN